MRQDDRERICAVLMRGIKPAEWGLYAELHQECAADVDALEPIIDAIIRRERDEAVADVRRHQGPSTMPEVRELEPPVSPKGPELPVPQMRHSVG